MQRIPAESAQRMDDDEGERLVRSRGFVDHLLEDGPIVVERGSSRLAEDLDDVPPLTLTVRATLRNLVRERKVAFGLPRRRDASVNCGPGHRSILVAQDGVDLVSEEGAPEGKLGFERRRERIRTPAGTQRRLSFILTGLGGRLVRVNGSLSEGIFAANEVDDCGLPAVGRRAEPNGLTWA